MQPPANCAQALRQTHPAPKSGPKQSRCEQVRPNPNRLKIGPRSANLDQAWPKSGRRSVHDLGPRPAQAWPHPSNLRGNRASYIGAGSTAQVLMGKLPTWTQGWPKPRPHPTHPAQTQPLAGASKPMCGHVFLSVNPVNCLGKTGIHRNRCTHARRTVSFSNSGGITRCRCLENCKHIFQTGNVAHAHSFGPSPAKAPPKPRPSSVGAHKHMRTPFLPKSKHNRETAWGTKRSFRWVQAVRNLKVPNGCGVVGLVVFIRVQASSKHQNKANHTKSPKEHRGFEAFKV